MTHPGGPDYIDFQDLEKSVERRLAALEALVHQRARIQSLEIWAIWTVLAAFALFFYYD